MTASPDTDVSSWDPGSPGDRLRAVPSWDPGSPGDRLRADKQPLTNDHQRIRPCLYSPPGDGTDENRMWNGTAAGNTQLVRHDTNLTATQADTAVECQQRNM